MEIAEIVTNDNGLRLRVVDETGEALLVSDLLARGSDSLLAPLAEGSIVLIERQTAATDASPPADAATICRDDSGQPIVCANADTALAEVYRIAMASRLRLTYPPEVTAEVAAIEVSPGIDDPELADWTDLPFVTMDYEDSFDLDQAVYVERHGDGFRVCYALADAAYYVPPDSALFREAMRRGASYYLPGLTIPMLPPQLSEGIVSLNEGVDRRALVFELALDSAGEVTRSALIRARVRSRRKLSYDAVQGFVDSSTAGQAAPDPLGGQPFCESIMLLGEVGKLRIARAEARDVVQYDRVTARLSLGAPTARHLDSAVEIRNDVQRWNEQISLATNIAGAAFLTAQLDPSTGLAGLFRIHPPPNEEALAHLASAIGELVTALDLDESWHWQRSPPERESLADYLARLPDQGSSARLARALQRQAMLINQPSAFSTEPGPHYGIGAPAYSRFSAPMREVVGVVTEQMAYQQLEANPVSEIGLTGELIEAAVAAGNRAKKIQKRITREANKLAMDQLFARDLDLVPTARPIRAATLMGTAANKIYIQLDDPPADIKLYVEDQARLLNREVTCTERYEVVVAGRAPLSVGDRVNVRVDSYSHKRRRWLLVLVDTGTR